jgi:neutral ceramidase
MKTFKFLFLILIFSFVISDPCAQADDAPLYIGTGKSNITPPIGTPLAGFGKRKGKPSTGAHDPLYARAAALSRGKNTLVFLSLDLVLVDEELRQAILKKVRETEPLREDQFTVFATHTHSGVGAIGGRFWARFIMGKFRKPVFNLVVEKSADAVLKALKEKKEVQAEFGETRIDEMIENRMDPKLDKTPDWLRVLRFKEKDGTLAAQFIFMAAHPTLASKSNYEFSADFPGALCDSLEKSAPDSLAIFFNGAAADLRPHSPEIADAFDRIQVYGSEMARTIEEMTYTAQSLDGPWKSMLIKTKLPATKLRRGKIKMPSLIGGRFFPRSSYFSAIRLDHFLFLTFPAEIDSETGREIEKLARARLFTPLIIGYANDYIAYVVSQRYYPDQGQYESTVSFYGKKMDYFVMETAMRLTDQLLSKEEKEKINPPGTIKYFPSEQPLSSSAKAEDPVQDSRLRGNDENTKGLAVLKLQGDPYHIGFEEGRLLKDKIREETKSIFRYFRSEIPVPLLNRAAIQVILNRGLKQMEPYISYSEYLQMKGIADGSGVPFKTIRQMHAMPEIYPSWCTNGAYWGKATEGGRLIAIRNLDWNRKIGVHHFPAVKVITTAGQKSYANIGYAGFGGVLSGMNDRGISVGQIGAKSSDESMKGVPMPFLLKRVLSESDSLEDAEAFFKRNPLTRGYNYVIADAVRKEALVVEATHTRLSVFRDKDPKEANVPYALCVENALFRGDPALDPDIRDVQTASKGNPKKAGLEPPGGSAYEIRYRKHGELVQQNYGKINSEKAMEIANELAPGSNIQSVIYAYPEFWVANAKGDLKATESGYVRMNLEEILLEQQEAWGMEHGEKE